MPPIAILTADQERVRGQLRAVLGELDAVIAGVGATIDDRSVLADAVRGLDELFLLVVVGEFNAGKSALLNELIGARILEEGVTPTTAAVSLIRFGESATEEWRGKGILERRVPSAALRDLAVVDTPGTNAIVRQHEQLTRDFVPRADLVLFVTSADRPLTETERELLDHISAWGKKVVVVINKVDLLESPEALNQVVEFVRDGLRSTLDLTPPIFAISVRLARSAAESRDQSVTRALLAASHFDELRNYVLQTLDETERLRLKLATPLGVAGLLAEKYRRLVDERLGAITDDLSLVENVEAQIDLYATDLRQNFRPRLAEVENVIHELNARGGRFFEENVRLGKVIDLLNPERTRGAFEREVVTDTAERIDQVISNTVDWFVDAEATLWRHISTMIHQRQQAQLGAAETPDFIAARREVLQSVAERTRRELGSFDREHEAREVGNVLRDAVAQTALAEIGAVSLGAAIALLFGTLAADFTGLLSATLLASLGLFIIPNRRRKALADFQLKTEELRARLVQALSTQLDREIVGSTERVREAIAPYTRYVRAEGSRLEGQRAAIAMAEEQLGKLRAEIEARTPARGVSSPRP
jgi:small GTP-binding protein